MSNCAAFAQHRKFDGKRSRSSLRGLASSKGRRRCVRRNSLRTACESFRTIAGVEYIKTIPGDEHGAAEKRCTRKTKPGGSIAGGKPRVRFPNPGAPCEGKRAIRRFFLGCHWRMIAIDWPPTQTRGNEIGPARSSDWSAGERAHADAKTGDVGNLSPARFGRKVQEYAGPRRQFRRLVPSRAQMKEINFPKSFRAKEIAGSDDASR